MNLIQGHGASTWGLGGYSRRPSHLLANAYLNVAYGQRLRFECYKPVFHITSRASWERGLVGGRDLNN